jgi:hexosaminidase
MNILLPAPRELERRQGQLESPGRLSVSIAGDGPAPEAESALEDLAGARGAVRCQDGAPGSVPLDLRLAGDLPEQGYTLLIDADGIQVEATDRLGALHAIQTLGQLWPAAGGALPRLRIRDWPDFARRGFMLDISRDRVPTMETLRDLVDRMAALKMNVLQLYTEHTFAYREHEAVWRDASPMTAGEVRHLDAYCRARGIELVPNQNSFGHMERWLRHPAYHSIAERENGGCLAPTGEAAAFMSALYDELLPCFGSRRINIGCDETFDLGRGRSRDLCAERGTARVYLDFIQRLFADLHGRGRHVELWGDIVLQHPELIDELPRKNLTALAWYYEAPREPSEIPAALLETLARFGWTRELMAGFSGHAPAFQNAGVPFQVCPGTSSWNTFVGRWSNARENIRDAVDWGLRCGAEGMLLTDWGDNGHLQPPCVSWPGLAWGAALSWCRETNTELDVAAALGAHVFESRELADVALGLADAYLSMGLESSNAAPFFAGMRLPLDADPNAFVLRGTPDRTKLEQTAELFSGAREQLAGGDGVSADLRQAAGLARHGTWRLLRGRLGAGPTRSELAADLEDLRAEQRERWLATARPGGLEDSLARLDVARGEYGEETEP